MVFWQALKLRGEVDVLSTSNQALHRERQKDVRTLRQKIKRYREALAKGAKADLFAFLGDRKAEAEAEKLEKEEWELVDDIEKLVRRTRPATYAARHTLPAPRGPS